jgi:predicted dehydrogenase
MAQRSNRRRFIQTTAAVGVGYWAGGGVSPRPSRAAIDEISFACIGVGGKGDSDSQDAGRSGNVVGICDINDRNLLVAQGRWPKAKKYNDYRKMLDQIGSSIDAVTVSTPDHSHAPAAALSLKMGKATFTQKPLTKSIHEARVLGEMAAAAKVATQMGNQGTANSTLRQSAALIKAGAIGNVTEVHVWTNRPVWPQGLEYPTDTPAVPAHIHWDLFLGPAQERPYNPAYTPFKWRGWWDYGTGALGDMACHTLNMSFMALNLRDPTSVVATTSGHNKQSYPGASKIVFEFPQIGDRGAIKMVWYDGGNKPPAELLPPREAFIGDDGKQMIADDNRYRNMLNTGALVVGDKGSLLSPADYGSDSRHTGIWANGEYHLQSNIKDPAVEYVTSPGHFKEWVEAIKNGTQSVSNFPNYAGPLTETILLGNLAVWADGKKIEWDAKNLIAKNAPEVAHIVKPEYRDGYTLDWDLPAT